MNRSRVKREAEGLLLVTGSMGKPLAVTYSFSLDPIMSDLHGLWEIARRFNVM